MLQVPEYPNEDDLIELQKVADSTPVDFDFVVSIIDSIWSECGKMNYNRETGELELITGGWSGNEEVIGVLQSTMFWRLHWHTSSRGGYFLFKK